MEDFGQVPRAYRAAPSFPRKRKEGPVSGASITTLSVARSSTLRPGLLETGLGGAGGVEMVPQEHPPPQGRRLPSVLQGQPCGVSGASPLCDHSPRPSVARDRGQALLLLQGPQSGPFALWLALQALPSPRSCCEHPHLGCAPTLPLPRCGGRGVM